MGHEEQAGTLDVQVQAFHPRDADQLAEVVVASADPDRLVVAAQLHDLLWVESIALLAFSGTQLVGYIRGDVSGRKQAAIRWVHVLPPARRLGVGTALIRSFILRALLDGCEELILDGSAHGNGDAPAMGFLLSLGFNPGDEQAPRRHVADIHRVLERTRRPDWQRGPPSGS